MSDSFRGEFIEPEILHINMNADPVSVYADEFSSYSALDDTVRQLYVAVAGLARCSSSPKDQEPLCSKILSAMLPDDGPDSA